MNRLDALFNSKSRNILSVYGTAGYPSLNDTTKMIEHLDEAGADIVEIGMPFSDPVADGAVIQASSLQSLKNGMTLKLLFKQLEHIREKTEIPIVLMGYLNPVIQYGVESFCKSCQIVGVDGVILPDLPPEIFNEEYRDIFERYNIKNAMLVPPQASDERIKQLDKWTSGFLYVVSSAATTGASKGFQEYQIEYFKRLNNLGLQSPTLIGFGISDHDSFIQTCKYANGAIIGSAYINAISGSDNIENATTNFVKGILNN